MEQEQNQEQPQEQANAVPTFQELGLNEKLLASVKYAGFKQPSPVQALAIPHILAGKDVIGQAHTGTGKTAAFALPTIQNMKGNVGVEVLVITPTRELANQVSDEIYSLGRSSNIRTVTVYGGRSYGQQIGLIKRGAQVVVATPGRLLDMLKGNKLGDFAPTTVILDEADEMLDMGFLDDINDILSYLPTDRQTLLFSATMPPPIRALTEKYLFQPETVSVTKDEVTNIDIEQQYYVIDENERDHALTRLIDSLDTVKSIIFCRTKKEVDRLSTMLVAQGYAAKGLHGDLEQDQRDEVLKGFRGQNIEILIATDVAARGLNVRNISHVFNYHIPFDPQSYVHRIGRTGRAGDKGVAITLVTPLEFKELQRIRKSVGTAIAHRFIPSKNEIRSQKIATLIEDITAQSITDEACGIYTTLAEQNDPDQLACRLISYLQSNQSVKGPENIGLSAEDITRLLEKQNRNHSNNRNGRSNSHHRRRSGGGGNRGGNRSGGGGYNNNRR